ncbi:hypothetical protein M2480_000961 [Parabacteroides sp. PFB2-12]|uniref:BACON domain-containing protein n=1 Tax=unclassified Parabacteroides TaxID=2649774 RepID=UPI0024767709|nr:MULTISPECIES: BACON domain-containing protein [unclassified Parabacteroides]MDH6341582.1 hypothetical protein [Parabacteroides sp. PM6-13]MDH6389995.1 hypothetical protein [Parabacteroides sp. PFB2-12]
MKHFIYILFLLLLCGCEDITPPEKQTIVVTTQAVDISKNSALVKVKVKATPSTAVKEAGVIWGTDEMLETGTDKKSSTDISAEEFSFQISNLNSSTNYYCPAYAIDKFDNSIFNDIKPSQTSNCLLSISIETIDVGYEAGEYRNQIISDIEWSIISDQPWCSPQQSSGHGDVDVIISLEENTSEQERIAILTLSSTEQIPDKTIIVIQKSKGNATFSYKTTAASSFEGGSGTEADPYLVVNTCQLKKLVEDVNNGNSYRDQCFKLMTDIEVTSNEWEPIGAGTDDKGYTFNGPLDGNGRTIKWKLYSNKASYFGFWGMIDYATIKNLNIAAEIKSEYTGNGFAMIGALVGRVGHTYYSQYSIESCIFSGTITAKGSRDLGTYLGGIAGGRWNFNEPTIIIRNCKMTESVKGGISYGGYYIGGIIGWGDGVIDDCNVSGNVTGGKTTCYEQNQVAGSSTGDIIGRDFGNISNCTFSGTVIGGNGTAGDETSGISGSHHTGGIITNCAVTSSALINGGEKGALTPYAHYITGEITGRNHGTIDNYTNNATVNSSGEAFDQQTGGIAGLNYGDIHRSLNTGNINAPDYYPTGGLVGRNINADYATGKVYSCCRNTGRVNGQAASDSNIIGSDQITPCPDNHTKR